MFNIPFLNEHTENALILGEFYRHNGNWKFKSLGAGFNGGLEPLTINYGVEISTLTSMPISLEVSNSSIIHLEKRIQQKAPHLVSLAKTASLSLAKYNLQSIKAKVAFVLDASGSMREQFKKAIFSLYLSESLYSQFNLMTTGLWMFGVLRKRIVNMRM